MQIHHGDALLPQGGSSHGTPPLACDVACRPHALVDAVQAACAAGMGTYEALSAFLATGAFEWKDVVEVVDVCRPWVSAHAAVEAMSILAATTKVTEGAALEDFKAWVDQTGIPRVSIVTGQPCLEDMPLLAERLDVGTDLWKCLDYSSGDAWETDPHVLDLQVPDYDDDPPPPSLPDGLVVCGDVNLWNRLDLVALPKGLTIQGCLDLDGCVRLVEWPVGLCVSRASGDESRNWSVNIRHSGLEHSWPPPDAHLEQGMLS